MAAATGAAGLFLSLCGTAQGPGRGCGTCRCLRRAGARAGDAAGGTAGKLAPNADTEVSSTAVELPRSSKAEAFGVGSLHIYFITCFYYLILQEAL